MLGGAFFVLFLSAAETNFSALPIFVEVDKIEKGANGDLVTVCTDSSLTNSYGCPCRPRVYSSRAIVNNIR